MIQIRPELGGIINTNGPLRFDRGEVFMTIGKWGALVRGPAMIEITNCVPAQMQFSLDFDYATLYVNELETLGFQIRETWVDVTSEAFYFQSLRSIAVRKGYIWERILELTGSTVRMPQSVGIGPGERRLAMRNLGFQERNLYGEYGHYDY